MITADELLDHLKALTPNRESASLVTASEHVDEYLVGLSLAPSEKAGLLANLQARFQRETKPSVMRSEILDFLSDRVMRLLEAN